jgi:formate dehydrogenase iron-sulfur subunit
MRLPDPNALYGPLDDPAHDAGWVDPPARKGFFTDTSVCIGCKACEVACKTWNLVPDDGFTLLGSSYDNTGALGANTWRHVAFIEQTVPGPTPPGRQPVDLGMPAPATTQVPGGPTAPPVPDADPTAPEPQDTSGGVRWLMSSDVCKHCTHAACLDVCPTGALFRTEYGTVVVQPDVCNGCGYCVPACPYGVIDRRTAPAGDPAVGLAQKCTLCYDRLGAGEEPACAKACPTDSIQFGDLDELRARADERLARLHEQGVTDARLYGADPADGVGGAGAFFLLLDEPEAYRLPPDPVVTTRDLPAMFTRATTAAVGLLAGAVLAFLGGRAGR